LIELAFGAFKGLKGAFFIALDIQFNIDWFGFIVKHYHFETMSDLAIELDRSKWNVESGMGFTLVREICTFKKKFKLHVIIIFGFHMPNVIATLLLYIPFFSNAIWNNFYP